jgi:hypothetical protein
MPGAPLFDPELLGYLVRASVPEVARLIRAAVPLGG